jgi:hypothetical protein
VSRLANCTQEDFFGKEAIVGSAGYMYSGSDTKSVTENLFYEIWGARVDNNFSAGTIRVPVYITTVERGSTSVCAPQPMADNRVACRVE